jgi:hypothetical protein
LFSILQSIIFVIASFIAAGSGINGAFV